MRRRRFAIAIIAVGLVFGITLMLDGFNHSLDNEVRRFTEAIGGLQADVWRNRFGRNYYTGAEWASAAVWLVGEARDSRTADLEVVMYRTVRFERP